MRRQGSSVFAQAKRRAAALDFEASRAAAAGVADAEPSRQADWLWASYAEATGAPDERRGAFDGAPTATLQVGSVTAAVHYNITLIACLSVCCLCSRADLRRRCQHWQLTCRASCSS